MKRELKVLSPLPERAAKIFPKLKSMRGLTDVEKTLQSLMLAATPDERWEINQTIVKRLPKNVRALMHQEMLKSPGEHERLKSLAY